MTGWYTLTLLKATKELSMHYFQRGFTLIEMAILFTALAGIVLILSVGQELLNHSKTRSTIQIIQDYENAIFQFRLQYNALPGDYRNAHDRWGDACAVSASACNGNGDGHLQTLDSEDYEGNKLWKHLQLAELLSGSFSGGNPTGTYRVGTDVPELGFRKGGVYAIYDNHHGHLSRYRDMLVFGSEVTDEVNDGALFTPSEAHAIDKKIDDGAPATGQIMGSTSTSNVEAESGSCSNGTGTELFLNATDYTLTNQNVVCKLLVLKISD